MIDDTPPLIGRVSDGDSLDDDVDYTSDVVSVAAVWEAFSDPESLLKDYSVDVYRTPLGMAKSSSNNCIIIYDLRHCYVTSHRIASYITLTLTLTVKLARTQHLTLK